VALRERIAEVEEDTEEAFRARRQLVKLLVQSQLERSTRMAASRCR
jgi:hypothetical protein